jgi:hypothetical protein
LEDVKTIQAEKIKQDFSKLASGPDDQLVLFKLGVVAQIQELNNQRLDRAAKLHRIRLEKLEVKKSMRTVERGIALQVQSERAPGKTKKAFPSVTQQKQQIEMRSVEHPDYIQWSMKLTELESAEDQTKYQIEWLSSEISIWRTFLEGV